MAIKKPSKASLYHPTFDETYKASPNFSDRNAIKRCISAGMTPEETAMEVGIKLQSVKTYFPKEEKVVEKKAAK